MTTIPFRNLAERASKPLAGPQARPAPTNSNEPSRPPELPEPGSPNRETTPKRKLVLASSLGVSLLFTACYLTMLVTAVLGTEPGTVALLICGAFIGTWVCFFFTQFFLSYGNPRAVRKDWPVIAALNFAPFCSVIISWVFVNQRAALAILVVAGLTLVCSYAGAALAALIARRRLPVIPPALG